MRRLQSDLFFFLTHLTLTVDWMAVSLGLWGYPSTTKNNHSTLGGQSW
ncbi:MAG: hypothetical protein AB7P69_01925 [Candidatus Binatia bacterium]